MSLEEGYIGIAKDFEARQKQHERAAHVLHSPYEVHHQMRLNKDNYITEIIDEGTREDMSQREFDLRPRWHMAWNMAPGGGNIAGYWKWPEKWLDYRLWHPDHGEVLLGPGLNATVFAKEYLNLNNNQSHRIGAVLSGVAMVYKGWELANAQVAQRIKDRLSITPHGYLSNSEKVASVYPNGITEFCEFSGLNRGKDSRPSLLRGQQPTRRGWHLISEEEYNLNPGPVFGESEEA